MHLARSARFLPAGKNMPKNKFSKSGNSLFRFPDTTEPPSWTVWNATILTLTSGRRWRRWTWREAEYLSSPTPTRYTPSLGMLIYFKFALSRNDVIFRYDGISNLSSMETYSEETDQWELAPSLSVHEGGVGVGVLPMPINMLENHWAKNLYVDDCI